MSVKILVISNYRQYHSVRPEAEVFIALANNGFDITVMTFADSEYIPYFNNAGIRVISFHPQKRFDRKEISFIRKELVKGKYDILHLFNSESSINGIRAAKNIPVKVILYRGFIGHVHWYNPGSYLKYLHPRVDMVVCNSTGVEESLRKQFLFRKNKTITIIKGHDPAWYDDCKPIDVRRTFGMPEDAFVLINVSNNRRMKGIKYLIKAMNELPAEKEIWLLMVGAGMDKEGIEKKNLNSGRIIITGFRDDSLNLVAGCDLFVLSSVRGEGLNKSVLEAMALGKPAIITDIPGTRDLVINGMNGWVVPRRDPKALAKAISVFADDPALASQMGMNARTHVEQKLNIRDTIQQTKELYERMAANG